MEEEEQQQLLPPVPKRTRSPCYMAATLLAAVAIFFGLASNFGPFLLKADIQGAKKLDNVNTGIQAGRDVNVGKVGTYVQVYVHDRIKHVLHRTVGDSKAKKVSSACQVVKARKWLGHQIQDAEVVLDSFGLNNVKMVIDLAMSNYFLPTACDAQHDLSARDIDKLVKDTQDAVTLKGAGKIFSPEAVVKVTRPGECSPWPHDSAHFCHEIGHDYPIPFDIAASKQVVALREANLQNAWTQLTNNAVIGQITSDMNCEMALKHALCFTSFPLCDEKDAFTACMLPCQSLHICFQQQSSNQAGIDFDEMENDCKEACKRRNCGAYQCPNNYVMKRNALYLIGDSVDECCEVTCSTTDCPKGYLPIEHAYSKPGSSVDDCCVASCASHTCPAGYSLNDDAANVTDSGWQTCCHEPQCKVPGGATRGYDFSGAHQKPGDLRMVGFKPKGVECAEGWHGTVEYKPCAKNGAPYRVSGCMPRVRVSAGPYHSLFLKANSEVWAAGENKFGQLGDGSRTERDSPVKIMDDVQEVAAGDHSHSMFLKANGEVWAAGRQ
eukprot:TRINITY_DN3328_c0_g1_i4.p1 TRINITY_DN3328_c0_g1~~TRINITY_DN3328_c0_g1_i4.p1  ORF type:complete len:584 (-),score=106.76 TRINITY_DN3328_c0_g1_i4:629-2281(-)